MSKINLKPGAAYYPEDPASFGREPIGAVSIKKESAELLRKMEVINDKTVGKVVLEFNVNCGGVREIKRVYGEEKIA